MNTLWPLVLLLVFTQFVICRDFYLGMFKRNDFLVAQDVIYKAPSPFGVTTASYGRLFKCPITYFRVVDRLGMGRGPITTIVRGGLRKKFIAVRIKSTYRLPVSVNIYVGCENKQPSTFRTTRKTTPPKSRNDKNSDSIATTDSPLITMPISKEISDENDGQTPKNETGNKEADNKDSTDGPNDQKKDDGAVTNPTEKNEEKKENNEENKENNEENKENNENKDEENKEENKEGTTEVNNEEVTTPNPES